MKQWVIPCYTMLYHVIPPDLLGIIVPFFVWEFLVASADGIEALFMALWSWLIEVMNMQTHTSMWTVAYVLYAI